jgi:pre-rRNA-processing protein TSR4
MTPSARDDWSDSDDDFPSAAETSVLLGIPDGLIDAPSDICDAAVSRIGGHPV